MIGDFLNLSVHAGYLVPIIFSEVSLYLDSLIISLQDFLIPGGIKSLWVHYLSSVVMFCWYHTSLSQIFIALSRSEKDKQSDDRNGSSGCMLLFIMTARDCPEDSV